MFSRPPRTSVPPILIDRDDDFVLGVWRHLLIAVFCHETTLKSVAAISACVREQSTGADALLGGMAIVEPHAPLPPQGIRTLLARNILAASSWKFSAMVYEGTGFRAAAVRGVIIGVGLLAQMPFPHRTFATVAEASEWISGRAREAGADDLPVMGICAAVGQLRQPALSGAMSVSETRRRP
jgi:hypothetical protein